MHEVRITVNGQPQSASPGTSVAALLASMGVDPARVAIERNEEVVPRQDLGPRRCWRGGQDRDRLPSWAEARTTTLVLAGKRFKSRLLIGTGKYKSVEETRKAIELTGAEIVTVALRRVDLTPGRPHGAGRRRPQEAHPLAQHRRLLHRRGGHPHLPLARELGLADMVKLEVIGDQQTLFPDGPGHPGGGPGAGQGGFIVLPYCMDDPILAKKLEEVGCAAGDAAGRSHRLGPGHPQPLQHPHHPRAGQGPHHRGRRRGDGVGRGVAMELGCDGVLMNTAVAGARTPC
jgi:thiazole synthase